MAAHAHGATRTAQRFAALAAACVLAGCVSVPQGPTVAVMPGTAKSFDQFQADNGSCREFAQSSIAGATQAAQNQVGANVVGSAVVGALIGAAFGSWTGDAGYGAAWGAGTGVLLGSPGASYAGAASSSALQQQYNAAYMQCMYARGNQVPVRVVQRAKVPTAPGTAARAYRVPADATAAPPGTPPPARQYAVPADAIAPPPGTPAPQ